MRGLPYLGDDRAGSKDRHESTHCLGHHPLRVRLADRTRRIHARYNGSARGQHVSLQPTDRLDRHGFVPGAVGLVLVHKGSAPAPES